MPRESVVFFTDRDLGKRFPGILAAGGLTVEPHGAHFEPDCPDEIWLEAVSKRGWVAVTHDSRIRYKANELAAVVRHRARLVVVVGKAPFPELADNFVASAEEILTFIERNAAPWIAKLYRPTASKSVAAPMKGRIVLWYPRGVA